VKLSCHSHSLIGFLFLGSIEASSTMGPKQKQYAILYNEVKIRYYRNYGSNNIHPFF